MEFWAKTKESVGHQVTTLTNILPNALANAIFEGLDEFGLYTMKIGDRNKVGVHVEREVFDNYDALATWTVIDRARIRMDGTPLGMWTTLADGSATGELGSPYASFIFEPQLNLEWTNVRQIDARNFKKREVLIALREQRREMRERLKAQYEAAHSSENANASEKAGLVPPPSPDFPPEPDANVNEMNPFTPWYYFDPSIRARFSKIPSLISFPLRTPLSVSTLRKKMTNGEVISWAFSGRVEVGAAVGWKIIPDPSLQTAGVDYRVTAVADGEYRISILREDDRFAKVKLSKLTRKGTHQRLRVGLERKQPITSFFLFKGSKIEQNVDVALKTRIVPFESDRLSLHGQLFDIGYRYDFDSADGREAYHRAVLGSFALSEEIAARDVNADLPAVQKIFERKGKTHDLERKRHAELAFLMKYDRIEKQNIIEARIQLPDGDHHVFRSVAETGKRIRNGLAGNDEKTSRKISVLLDRDLYEKNDPASLFLIGESFYDDTSTSGKELNKTITEIENFVGETDLFPEISPVVPRRKDPGDFTRMKPAKFGRSSFYWGFHFQRPDVEHFLEAGVKDRIRLITATIPPQKRLEVFNRWTAATTAYHEANPEKVFHTLKALFEDRSIGRHLMLLLRATLGERQMDYFVTATNPTFGRIQRRGRTQTSVDRIFTLTDQQMGFEGYSRRLKDDSEAVIENVSAEQTPAGLIRVQFTMKENAKTLYFRLSRPRDFMGSRDIVEIVYTNPTILKSGDGPIFGKGLNTILLDPASETDIFYRLAKGMRRDRNYLLQIAFSRYGQEYGPLASKTFTAGTGYPKPRLDSKQLSN